MRNLQEDKVQALVEAVFAEEGYDLVELSVSLRRGDVYIVILADRLRGGITMGECSRLNRQLAQRIDEAEFFPEGYFLEVNSPGVDRPLKTTRDFLRVQGQPVHCFLKEPVLEKKEYIGIVERVAEGTITLRTEAAEEIFIPLAVLQKAVSVIQLRGQGSS